MKNFILISAIMILCSIKISAQHCSDSTFNKQSMMNCCTNGVRVPETNQKGCCTNQNATNASLPNGNCPKPSPAKVKAVAKPKED